MKIAHKLDSAEKITREELERVLKGSLQASSFEVDTNQMEQIMNGIMKAGDPEGEGAISFVSLVQLLDKHQLYISESGLIARYGKTKRSQGRSLSRGQKFTERIKMFFTNNVSSLAWFGVYVLLNVFLAIVGVLTAGREGWERFAYGTGPVLSMNCVLVLLPSLKSLIHAMRGSYWMNKVRHCYSKFAFRMLLLPLVLTRRNGVCNDCLCSLLAGVSTDEGCHVPCHCHVWDTHLDWSSHLDTPCVIRSRQQKC